MTTKAKIMNRFYTEFMDNYVLPDGLEDEWLMKAIGDFEEELYELNYDSSSELFSTTLKESEISMLSRLMYKYYLKRNLDRVIKLSNIIGKDININGTGQKMGTTRQAYEEWCIEVDKYFNKLKQNSFK